MKVESKGPLDKVDPSLDLSTGYNRDEGGDHDAAHAACMATYPARWQQRRTNSPTQQLHNLRAE